ncbi:MAG: prepilin-type N-terminal cleavage/methylation domain-containing protein [Bdellovibrionota bacterium]
MNFYLAKSSKGFSLIEVLLATIILAGALVALSSSWSGTVFSFRKSEKVQIITSLLKSKTTELEIKYNQVGFTAIPEEEDGDFGDEFPDLSWKAEVRVLEFPDLTPLMMAEDGRIDEMTRTIVKQMTGHFSKNIKEMRITIVWKAKSKSVQYSTTSYIVNYAGGVPAPGAGI